MLKDFSRKFKQEKDLRKSKEYFQALNQPKKVPVKVKKKDSVYLVKAKRVRKELDSVECSAKRVRKAQQKKVRVLMRKPPRVKKVRPQKKERPPRKVRQRKSLLKKNPLKRNPLNQRRRKKPLERVKKVRQLLVKAGRQRQRVKPMLKKRKKPKPQKLVLKQMQALEPGQEQTVKAEPLRKKRQRLVLKEEPVEVLELGQQLRRKKKLPQLRRQVLALEPGQELVREQERRKKEKKVQLAILEPARIADGPW